MFESWKQLLGTIIYDSVKTMILWTYKISLKFFQPTYASNVWLVFFLLFRMKLEVYKRGLIGIMKKKRRRYQHLLTEIIS